MLQKLFQSCKAVAQKCSLAVGHCSLIKLHVLETAFQATHKDASMQKQSDILQGLHWLPTVCRMRVGINSPLSSISVFSTDLKEFKLHTDFSEISEQIKP